MPSEKASEKSMVLVVNGSGPSKWRLDCCLACILFPVVHLLQELLCLLLVDKGQSGQAFFQLKGVEKDTVLVVAPIFEDFLVPNHSSVSGLPRR
jgi:hypothetical protein